MELEFERDNITGFERIAEVTICQEETLESIVPDACPDILRIVDVCGQAALTGKQARDGMAQVSGAVRASILYQPEGGGGLRRVAVDLPFTCQADAPGLTDRGVVEACPRLRSAEARALNPRKVLLRVDLAVDVRAFQPSERPVCRQAADPGDGSLCQKQFHGECYLLSAVQERPFTFTDSIRLQGGQGEAPALLASRAQAVCAESRLIGSKLIFKGAVELSLLLQEPGGALMTHHESLPFSQIMEAPGAGEEGDCRMDVEVVELQCESAGDGREVDVDLELLAQAQVWCRRPVTVLQDVYSTACQMEVDSEPQDFCQLQDLSVRPQAVREMLETAGMVRSVVDSRLAVGQITQAREGDEVVLTAETRLSLLFLDENELVQSLQTAIPVTCRLACPAGARCSCRCVPAGEVFAAPAAGGVEARFNVEFHCLTTSSLLVPAVRSASLGGPRSAGEGERPSVVLRMAVPGEGLWELAKTYGTTTAQILQANELEEDALPEGRMLLIPSGR